MACTPPIMRARPCAGRWQSAFLVAAVAACLSWPGLSATAEELDTSLPAPAAAPTPPSPSYDIRGIKRDTYYFLGYQAAAMAVILVWPRRSSR